MTCLDMRIVHVMLALDATLRFNKRYDSVIMYLSIKRSHKSSDATISVTSCILRIVSYRCDHINITTMAIRKQSRGINRNPIACWGLKLR